MTLPSFYLPPLSWFSQALHSENPTLSSGKSLFLTLEVQENFPKQTLRNRCYIDSPNGKLALSIPIDKENFSNKGKCLVRDVRISKQFPWQHQHWTAFESTYYNSPFFEFLQDDFRPIYTRDWTFLIDLNEALIERCFALLDVTVTIERTSQYVAAPDTFPTSATPYYQVFASKHGFLPDLSIIDLLFNMGNEAILYL